MAVTKETQLIRALWRQAFRKGSALVRVKDSHEANRLRFAFYSAVKPFREGRLVDEELEAAVAVCSVRVTEAGNLEIYRRGADALVAMEEALKGEGAGAGEEGFVSQNEVSPGLEPEPMTAEEAELRAMELRMQRLEQETREVKARTTPYYQREGEGGERDE